MGVIYINLDIFDKALANYQKAREIRESVENPDLEQIAYSYHNIGTVYQRQKKYADAITWHKKSVRDPSGNIPLITNRSLPRH